MAIKQMVLAASPEKTKKVAELKKKISDLTKRINARRKEVVQLKGDPKNDRYVSGMRDDIILLKRELLQVERHMG